MFKNSKLSALLSIFFCVSIFSCSSPISKKQITGKNEFNQEWLKIPAGREEPYTLNALLISDPLKTKSKLVILSHGTPGPLNRRFKLPEDMVQVATEFVKLGFSVLILERRGYGRSTFEYAESLNGCESKNFIRSTKAAATDIIEALYYARANLNIDKKNVILVGRSTGGLASVFAGSVKKLGVSAVINFSGGRGSHELDQDPCYRVGLMAPYAVAGKTSRIPSLWVYAENDAYFPPQLANSMLEAFKSKGGVVDFLMLPPFETEGHELFSVSGIHIWQPIVDDFFKKNNIYSMN